MRRHFVLMCCLCSVLATPVMNGHGAPTGHSALNDACDFVSPEFNATMLNVSGLFSADAAIQARGRELTAKHYSEWDLASFGNDPHAGVSETSGLLAVGPDLVRSSYKKPGELPRRERHFSSPARATAAHGRDVEAWWVEGMTDLSPAGRPWREPLHSPPVARSPAVPIPSMRSCRIRAPAALPRRQCLVCESTRPTARYALASGARSGWKTSFT